MKRKIHFFLVLLLLVLLLLRMHNIDRPTDQGAMEFPRFI